MCDDLSDYNEYVLENGLKEKGKIIEKMIERMQLLEIIKEKECDYIYEFYFCTLI